MGGRSRKTHASLTTHNSFSAVFSFFRFDSFWSNGVPLWKVSIRTRVSGGVTIANMVLLLTALTSRTFWVAYQHLTSLNRASTSSGAFMPQESIWSEPDAIVTVHNTGKCHRWGLERDTIFIVGLFPRLKTPFPNGTERSLSTTIFSNRYLDQIFAQLTLFGWWSQRRQSSKQKSDLNKAIIHLINTALLLVTQDIVSVLSHHAALLLSRFSSYQRRGDIKYSIK